jgi:hypothetical protein
MSPVTEKYSLLVDGDKVYAVMLQLHIVLRLGYEGNT